MATIRAIETTSVHQIQSGQVIVDLNSVVKELVENSLDAGATSIEVRFKNYGLDSIEVQDNGKGIAPEDFETVALKHYTSKLSSYDDLTTLETFGFRGEALSSLCALSKFHISTARAEDGAVGKKLEFETSGKFKGSSVQAVPRGTTVSVENLFYNLPVRRRELEKNIKREFGKVVNLLYAYACIGVGVRFSASNQIPKGKKTSVLSTNSNSTTKENIANVFGAKTLVALVKLDLHLEMEPTRGLSTQSLRDATKQIADRSLGVHVEGHISKPVFGDGRQAPDRQMFFVNSRPCHLPQVAKAFNEVYKSFNVSQSPFIFANLIMDTNSYDVNVSPDKRTIMLHDQTALLESLKTALTDLFDSTEHTVPQSQFSNRTLPTYKSMTVLRSESTGDTSEDGIGRYQNRDESSDREFEAGVRSLRVDHNRSDIEKPPNLIRDWVGRNTETRHEPFAREKKPISHEENRGFVKAAQVYAESVRSTKFAGAADEPGDPLLNNDSIAPVANMMVEETASSGLDGINSRTGSIDESADLETSPRRSPLLPRPVQDFNELMRRSSKGSQSPEPELEQGGDKRTGRSEGRPEPEISAVAPSSQKATPGPVQNAFDRMRPKRTPHEIAHITVGDTTTTTVIGSGAPYKRRRVHEPDNLQSYLKFSSSPLLTHGLRSFVAPGTKAAIDNDEQSATNSDDEEQSEDNADGRSDIEDDEIEDTLTRSGSAEAKGSSLPEKDATTQDTPLLDSLDPTSPNVGDENDGDAEYVDEDEKKREEDDKVARLIQEAELATAHPDAKFLRRASQMLKNGGNRKEPTLQLVQHIQTSVSAIERQIAAVQAGLMASRGNPKQNILEDDTIVKDDINDANAEAQLSLTVSKPDFGRMRIVGQFNLGFIVAVRPAAHDEADDELFIIDQHAADEKYNYERLQRTVTLQSQRLVHPKPLDLTAIEEEIVLNHAPALKANGFEIGLRSSANDDDNEENDHTPSRACNCHLLTLPISGEKTFDLSDLEELMHLLSEAPTGGTATSIPRPRKVQRMLAMRACRSSIMVGRTLTPVQMRRVVQHMGEMDKPWNCPHGRPTMRHLAGLGAWNGWREGDVADADGAFGGGTMAGRKTDWKAWLESRR